MLAVDLRDAGTRLRALIDAARAGEEVYIADGDLGAVRLVPCQGPIGGAMGTPRRPGRLRGQIRIADDFDAVDVEIADLFEGEM